MFSNIKGKNNLIFLSFLFLVACGGGGGDSNSTFENSPDSTIPVSEPVTPETVTPEQETPIVENILPTAIFLPSQPIAPPLNTLEDGEWVGFLIAANDIDGSVENVRLFINNNLISQKDAAPYQWDSMKDTALYKLAVGTYNIRAVITDNSGGITSVTTILKIPPTPPNAEPPVEENILPIASFTSPTPKTLEQGEPLKIEVSANDSNRSIGNIRLFINNNFVRQEGLAPYEWNSTKDKALNNLVVGTYNIRAVITDSNGVETRISNSLEVVPSQSTPTPTPDNTNEVVDPIDLNLKLVDYLAGEKVYMDNCASCHKPLSVSDKRNRSELGIRNAVANIRIMRTIVLTDEEYRVLEFALNNERPSELTEPTTPESAPDIIASTNSGYENYANNCVICHGDIAASSKRGASAISIQYALDHEVEMENISLSSIDVESVALALSDDGGVCRADTDPGPVVMRRLSNDEYTNTIRDLLGVTLNKNALPADSRAGNFTNIGSSNVNSEHAISYAALVPSLSESINETDNDVINKYLVCDISNTGQNCARSIIEQFIPRAFRRDVDQEETERFVDIFVAARELNETRESSLALAIEAILLSPHFNFMVEIDPNPESLKPRALNSFELASRLSYFLWASMPDDTLLDLARSGNLTNTNTLSQQVKRMLADNKSAALVDIFFKQWMVLNDFTDPNNSEFDHIDAQLRIDMVEETKQLFLKQFVQTDTDIRNLLSTRKTYVNQRLAEHYGISGISGEEFSEVSMTTERVGLLTQASFLVSTSKELESSPVARGKWVLDQLLCESPRTPPPDVGEVSIVENPDATLKELLAEHRKNSACAACHETMDPIGFGLENFDQLGHFREIYESGNAVDSLGELPGGLFFNGPAELSLLLKSDTRYVQCVTEKFVSYARGALSTARDNCRVKQITDNAIQDNFSVPKIINSIVQDISFTTRRTADED